MLDNSLLNVQSDENMASQVMQSLHHFALIQALAQIHAGRWFLNWRKVVCPGSQPVVLLKWWADGGTVPRLRITRAMTVQVTWWVAQTGVARMNRTFARFWGWWPRFPPTTNHVTKPTLLRLSIVLVVTNKQKLRSAQHCGEKQQIRLVKPCYCRILLV